jgi:GT2 family glycosyltransferase
MNKQIAILILFYNKLDQTKDCIHSFLPSGHKIYVLNNGSDETQWSSLKSTYKNHSSVVLLDAGKNLGVSGGRNDLINATKETWLLSVDNDIVIKPQQNWNELFEQFLVQHPEAKIICPHIFNVHEEAYSKQLQVVLKNNEVSIETGDYIITNCFPGGASIIHRNIFETYGLFDEEMFVGFEDYEFAIRAKLSEYGELKAYHLNEIELIHDHQFQKSSSDKEAVRQRYNEEKLKASYERLVSKFNIVFEHDWQWWTRKQVVDMTKSKWFSTVKERINKVLNR